MIRKYRVKKKRFIYRAIVGLAMLGYAAWHWLADTDYPLIIEQAMLAYSGILLGVMAARRVYRRIDSPNTRSAMTTLVFVLIAGLCIWLANTSVAHVASLIFWLLTALLLIVVSTVRYCRATDPQDDGVAAQ